MKKIFLLASYLNAFLLGGYMHSFVANSNDKPDICKVIFAIFLIFCFYFAANSKNDE